MTHKAKVLALLSDGAPHSHLELYALGCIAHSRVADLRRDGHNILAWREGDSYLYELVAPLDTEAEAVTGLDPSGLPSPAFASVSSGAVPLTDGEPVADSYAPLVLSLFEEAA